jgi:hypothetical protein
MRLLLGTPPAHGADMMNTQVFSISLCAILLTGAATACNDDAPPPKTSGSPSVMDQPAAKAPSVNASDVKAPQMNGPTVNLNVDTQNRVDAGLPKN